MAITGDVFLFFLGLLALILMTMSNRNILFAFSSSMIWFVLFLWMFFSTTPPLDISENWVQILSWVFLMLAVVPWLIRMDVEIRHESKGASYKTWGAPPKEEPGSRAKAYRKKLRERIR